MHCISLEVNRLPTAGINLPNSAITKVEDCNSSRESIDVESTQPEDIKCFPNIKTTIPANSDTKPLGSTDILSETSSAIQTSMIKQEDGGQAQVDWSLYHLGDMTLEVWLQTIRKHVLMSLIRHPK